MLYLLVGIGLACCLALLLIDKQYKIDQEDWDFREDGE